MYTDIKRVGIMIDSETIGLASSAVVWDLAAAMFSLNNPDPDQFDPVQEYLPIQPQLDRGATVDASTMGWWMNQPAKARDRMQQAIKGDNLDLGLRIRSIHRQLVSWISNAIADGRDYEIWCKGTDFDIPKITRLFQMEGLSIPWKYSAVRDLRTLCKVAGVESNTVAHPRDFIHHSALSDCKWQIMQYAAAMESLS